MKPLILFDFDGTLADTAPDLAAAANAQRTAKGMEPLPLEALRHMASHGARGLLGVALGLKPDDPDYEAAKQAFLAEYERNISVHTVLFPGVEQLLATLQERGVPWGIVTNKVTRLALPLVKHLDLHEASVVTVCGDTTAYYKPHPEPLLHAARVAGYAPEDCIYVGDDLRDIVAGKAAGMKTIAVGYGYTGDGDAVEAWGADELVRTAEELLPAIERLHLK